MVELKDTVKMMVSDDYKERFKAEYWQLSIRCEKLRGMIENWDNLGFTPTCTKDMLENQLVWMDNYRDALAARAMVEGISLLESEE